MLGKSKVGDLDVSIGGEENVLGFEIAVNDIERVQVIESERDFCREEFGHGIRETLSRYRSQCQPDVIPV